MTVDNGEMAVNMDYHFDPREDSSRALVRIPTRLLDQLKGITLAYDAPSLGSVIVRAAMNHVEAVRAAPGFHADIEAALANHGSRPPEVSGEEFEE